MAPPPIAPLMLPLERVRPEMLTVLPTEMVEMRNSDVPPAVLRWTVSRLTPGPLIVRFLLISNSPLVSVIVLLAGSEKVIVSPDTALEMASRSVHLITVHVPVPSSAVLFTVRVVTALLTGGRASDRERPIRITPNSDDIVITRALLTLIVIITVFLIKFDPVERVEGEEQ